MKKIYLSALLLLSGVSSWSQQNSIWSLPPYSLKFPITSNSYTPLPAAPAGTSPDAVDNSVFSEYNGSYGGQNQLACSNMMADAQGNILFFVNDGRIFDKEGYLLDFITPDGNQTEYSSQSELLIVPAPDDCKKYYLFYSSYVVNKVLGVGTTQVPCYSILDFNLSSEYNPSKMGALVKEDGVGGIDNAFELSDITDFIPETTNMDYPTVKGSAMFFASTPKKANDTYTVYIFFSNDFFRYTVDANGVSYDNYWIGPTDFGSREDFIPSEMELVPLVTGDYRLAISRPASSSIVPFDDFRIYTCKLNANLDVMAGSTQTITYALVDNNYQATNLLNTIGLEISPDGNIIYITHPINSNNPNAIEYVDLSQPNPTPQPLLVPNAADFQFSQIEIAQDGKLYFVGEDPNNPGTANRLATLDDPNDPSSTWTDNVLSINYKARYGTNNPFFQSIYNKAYTLPDQIDGMDYNAHFFQNLECCLANSAYEITNYPTVNSDTWQPGTNNNPFTTGNTVNVQTELRIKAGTILL